MVGASRLRLNWKSVDNHLFWNRITSDHGHALGSGLVNSVTDYLGATLEGPLEQHRQTLAVG